MESCYHNSLEQHNNNSEHDDEGWLDLLSLRRGWEIPQGEVGIDYAKDMIENVDYFSIYLLRCLGIILLLIYCC